MKNKIFVVGFGPGSREQMTGEAIGVIEGCDCVIGYQLYTNILKAYFPHKEYRSTPMKKERERCRIALELAEKGKKVAVVCSGDAGIYGMAGLILEMGENYRNIQAEVVPGITAATAGAALLGSPLGHDFAVISLSDLLTPWEVIEKRLKLAAEADFVICLYNPSSQKRQDYVKRACEIVMTSRDPDTVCGMVRYIGREGEEGKILTLKELSMEKADMFTTIYIGSSATRMINNRMVTPRGYATGGQKE